MGQCHKCNFPLKEGAIACPQCGDVFIPLDETHGTIDQASGEIAKTIEFSGLSESVAESGSDSGSDSGLDIDSESANQDGVEPGDKTVDFAIDKTIDLSQQTIDFSSSDYAARIAAEREEELGSVVELDDAGTGTIDAMGSDGFSVLADEGSDDDLIMELEEEFENTDERLTLNATGDEDAGKSTHVATTPSEAFGDDQGTYVVSPDSAFAKEHSDDVGTIQLPSTAGENAGERTAVFGTSDPGPGTVEAGSSGTEGRLKRLWDGVVGSSENPMHSLQAAGLQASDSIFERVATRRVVDASTRGVSDEIDADYQIVNKLGEGAMGIVFSARQTTIDRVVALKMAKPSFQQNEESRRRFLYEAQITADLDHSNIVPIHELGANESGMLFYSMKMVQGTGWNAVVRKKTREQNLEIFMKVADAIAFAHSKGVIHRDLKPENTMLGRFGEVFVTDWGTAINLTKDTTKLARPAMQGDKFITVEDGKKFRRGDTIALLDGEELYEQRQITAIDDVDPNRLYLRKKLTHTYQSIKDLRVMKMMNMAGTPCYMAPEMAGHDLPKISRLSDIYVLGAILYDIVTGRAPHTGKSVTECLRAALDNKVIVKGNDDPLLTIAYRAMESEPEDRYQSVEELQDAVREYRRHAESIALTDRSDELLKEAAEKGDYAMYSRTVFGYRDAIELWPENQAAVAGLKNSRLAFGEAAFKGGDYDLVLQTVDRSEPAEDALFLRAIEAKKKAESREKSLKKLQKAIAAVVAVAVVGLSGLSIYAFGLANSNKSLALSEAKEKNIALNAQKVAQEKEIAAITAEKAAREAEGVANELALKNKELAVSEKKEKLAAKEQERLAREAETAARKAETAAVEAKVEEQRQRTLAGEAAVAALKSEARAKESAAQIQLGEYSSSVALAKSQFEGFDVAQGRESLAKLNNLPMFVFRDDAQPDFDSWGLRRIDLLSNGDLLGTKVNGEVTASDCSASSGVTAIGTKDGQVVVFSRAANGLEKKGAYLEQGAEITAVAISPAGDECVFAFLRNGEGGLKRWNVADAEAQQVVAGEKRRFQRIAYTTDGAKVLAGINSGMWIWQRGDKWYEQPKAARVDAIRGDLLNVQSISPTQAFVTTRFQGEQVVLSVLDHSSGVSTRLTLPPLNAELDLAVHALIDNKVILGLANNQLLVGTLDLAARSIDELDELEAKHRSQVTFIGVDKEGRVITASKSEPVAHVWKYTNQKWLYETYLTGTPGNLAGVGVLGAGQVLGVDESGTVILWDVARQKQRSRMQRQAKGEVESYAASVQAVVAGRSDGVALAVDENGAVDRWNLVDGSSELIDSQRWSYIGHTPGAELVDSAVDIERGVVITAARLRHAVKKYLKDAEHDWEFCLWDAATGAMKKRWSVENRKVAIEPGEAGAAGAKREESIDQRISLVDSGRQILFSSDRETRLVDLETGVEKLVKTDFGTFFAVPHPSNESLVMLVKRSGAVRLLDLQRPSTWGEAALQEFTLAGSSESPLRGVWSKDGQRFYLAFSAGGLASFDWNAGRLKLTWSNRKLEDDPTFDKLRSALQVKSGRVRSHLDMDLMVDSSSGADVVYVASRNRELSGETKLLKLRFAGSDPVLVEQRIEKDVRWLQLQNGQIALSDRLHDSLQLDVRQIRSRQSVDGKIFVSTDAAQVYRLQEGKQQVMSYGRAKLISTAGASDGKSLLVLLEDGAIWRFDTDAAGSVAGEKQAWQRMGYSALGARELKLSADGTKLLIVSDASAKIVAADTGELNLDLGKIAAANWQAGQGVRLAVAREDGTLQLWSDGQLNLLPTKANVSDGAIVDVQFFAESWKDEQLAVGQRLLVHTENAQGGRLQFVQLDGLPIAAEGDAKEANKADVKTLLPGTRVKASPTEGIIVTGTRGGTVTLWFATPAYELYPRQLFDLEGHRGGDITCLAFSSDGKTIITADNKQRLYAWLSSDPLTKK